MPQKLTSSLGHTHVHLLSETAPTAHRVWSPSELKRNPFALSVKDKPFSSEEVFNALQFWHHYPRQFDHQVAFLQLPVQCDKGMTLSVWPDGEERLVSLDWEENEGHCYEVRMVGYAEPVRIRSRFVATPDPNYQFQYPPSTYQFWFKSSQGQYFQPIGCLTRSGKILVDISHLEHMHEKNEEILMHELASRNIDCGSFLRASRLCRKIVHEHREHIVTNGGHWPTCVDYAGTGRTLGLFKDQSQHLVEAELCCKELNSRLQVEIAHQSPKLQTTDLGETKKNAQHVTEEIANAQTKKYFPDGLPEDDHLVRLAVLRHDSYDPRKRNGMELARKVTGETIRDCPIAKSIDRTLRAMKTNARGKRYTGP